VAAAAGVAGTDLGTGGAGAWPKAAAPEKNEAANRTERSRRVGTELVDAVKVTVSIVRSQERLEPRPKRYQRTICLPFPKENPLLSHVHATR
jgi:hypothetical protein